MPLGPLPLKSCRGCAVVAVTEFFAPFAHVPGRFEWCRIRSPTHGVFDCFIVLAESTSVPATVYVRSDNGEAFMAERYPECRAIRVPAESLRLSEAAEGRVVSGVLQASEGPVREVQMMFRATDGIPVEVPYGGTGQPVWGGRWSCTGVDLNLAAAVSGHVVDHEGNRENLAGAEGVVTCGSYGTIAPL